MGQEKKQQPRVKAAEARVASSGLEAMVVPVTTDVTVEMLRRIVRKLEGKTA